MYIMNVFLVTEYNFDNVFNIMIPMSFELKQKPLIYKKLSKNVN